MAQYQFSVESIKFYDKGADGAMGTANPVQITPIAEGSASMTIPEVNTNDIKAEDVAGVVASLPTDQDAIEFNFQSLDFANTSLMQFFGGTNAAGIYSFPATGAPIIQKSFELITKPYGGKKSKFTVPLAQITSSGDVQFVKDDLSKISVKVKVLTPFNGSGVAQSPWQKEEITVA